MKFQRGRVRILFPSPKEGKEEERLQGEVVVLGVSLLRTLETENN